MMKAVPELEPGTHPAAPVVAWSITESGAVVSTLMATGLSKLEHGALLVAAGLVLKLTDLDLIARQAVDVAARVLEITAEVEAASRPASKRKED